MIEDLDSREAGHHHVQQGNIKVAFVQKLKSFRSAGSFFNIESTATKPSPRTSAEIGIVIRNQQFDLRWLAQRHSPLWTETADHERQPE